MNEQKLTPELEADLRAKINPVYVNVRGTESYERNAMLNEIDRLRHVVDAIASQQNHSEDKLDMVKQSDAAAVAWFEAEESTRGFPLTDVINSFVYSARWHSVEPSTRNPVWSLYAAPPEVAVYDSRNDVAALREDKLLLNARIDELLPEVAALQFEITRLKALMQITEEFRNYYASDNEVLEARIKELETRQEITHRVLQVLQESNKAANALIADMVSETEQLRMSWHNARIANSWVSINDRLPELDERIIVFRPDAHMGPQFDENIALRMYLGGKFSGAHAVTHWMPLPAAPTPESDKP